MPRSIKTTALISVLILLLMLPVSAAADSSGIWHLSDHIMNTVQDGTNTIVYFEFDADPWYKVIKNSTQVFSGSVPSGEFEVAITPGSLTQFNICPLGVYYIGTGSFPANGGAIDVSDIVADGAIDLSYRTNLILRYTIEETANGGLSVQFDVKTNLFCFDADKQLIGTVSEWVFTPYNKLAVGEYNVQNLEIDLYERYCTKELPSNTAYIIPYFVFQFTAPDVESGIHITSARCMSDRFYIRADYKNIDQDTATMLAIDKKLGELNGKLDDILQQPEQEKQEASSSGGDAADKLASAIPDKSSGFMAAIAQLTNAMRYSGTDAKLTVPAITLPEIPGVMPSYQLSTEQEIDFGFWVDKMPSTLLELCRILLTLGLIFYSFKELYSLISYAMTLKGGGSDV